MNLPEGWRLGRLQDGYRTLYYKDTWAERIWVGESFQQTVENCVENPNPRLYPVLYKDNVLDLNIHNQEQGIRNLVKSGLLTPGEAFNLQPSIKAWLKRNKLWSEDKPRRNLISFNGIFYEKRGRSWYSSLDNYQNPLRKKTHFQSVWDARVAFARNECSLEQIAEYSWGAVFEVLGDQMQLLPDFEFSTLSAMKSKVVKEIQYIMYKETSVASFKKINVNQVWDPVYYINPLSENPIKECLFWDLIDRLFDCEISGYGARLIFNNAHPNTIKREQDRWNKGHLVYIPHLVNKQQRLDSMTLEEARIYIQKHHMEMIAIGAVNEDYLVTAFTHQGNRYGIHVDSGKLFAISDEDSRYIPKRFSKWSEEKQREYLGCDYEKLRQEYLKRLAACRKLYHYLKHCQGLSCDAAWKIASEKHRKLSAEFERKKREAARWNCLHANRSAITMQITTPIVRWEVA